MPRALLPRWLGSGCRCRRLRPPSHPRCRPRNHRWPCPGRCRHRRCTGRRCTSGRPGRPRPCRSARRPPPGRPVRPCSPCRRGPRPRRDHGRRPDHRGRGAGCRSCGCSERGRRSGRPDRWCSGPPGHRSCYLRHRTLRRSGPAARAPCRSRRRCHRTLCRPVGRRLCWR